MVQTHKHLPQFCRDSFQFHPRAGKGTAQRGCGFGDTFSVEQEAHLALSASLSFHTTLLTTGPGFCSKKRGMSLHVSVFCESLQVALVAVNIIGDPADYGNDSMSSVSAKHPWPFTDAPSLPEQVPGVMG